MERIWINFMHNLLFTKIGCVPVLSCGSLQGWADPTYSLVQVRLRKPHTHHTPHTHMLRTQAPHTPHTRAPHATHTHTRASHPPHTCTTHMCTVHMHHTHVHHTPHAHRHTCVPHSHNEVWRRLNYWYRIALDPREKNYGCKYVICQKTRKVERCELNVRLQRL